MNIVSKCVHVGSSSRELTWKPAWLDKALRPSISNVIVFCHLILFVSSANYFQIVRRQCCLCMALSRVRSKQSVDDSLSLTKFKILIISPFVSQAFFTLYDEASESFEYAPSTLHFLTACLKHCRCPGNTSNS